MLEKEIEKRLVKKIKKIDGLCYKFVSPSNRGVPDRIIILENGEVIFVELKTEKGKLSELQKIQIEKLKKQGQRVTVVYGQNGVDRLTEYINRGRLDLITNEIR